jgi:three-Cys-motif partner protein
VSEDFFREKKEWSKYKDFILDYYLTPYLEKVKCLKRPILLVDCCAGPGMFDDGSKGSPLIISEHIKVLYNRGVDVRGLFLEKKRRFYSELQSNLKSYEAFVEPKHRNFTNYLDDIKQSARTSTVFLYVDPYGIKELPFSDLAGIYGSIAKHNSSVEVLLNFNSPALVRCGLAALKMDTTGFDIDADDDSVSEILAAATAMTQAEVDAIAGGQYWRGIVSDSNISFVEKEEAISGAYAQQMNKYFPWVCSFPIQKRYGQLPKYRLIYGTRHQDGILLMNDTMYKARELFLDQEFAAGKLFDLRPPEELKNIPLFTNRLLEIVKENEPISRKDLKLKGMQEFFCRYNSGDYARAVFNLLKGFEGLRLYTHSGKTRINDNELLSTKPFT